MKMGRFFFGIEFALLLPLLKHGGFNVQSIPLIKKIVLYSSLGFMPAVMACCPCTYEYAPVGSYTIEKIGAPAVEETVIRAAVDIGSGATKLRIAQVNVKNQKIEKILVDEAFTVHYQEHLEKSATKSFDDAVMQTGLDSLKKSAEIAKQYHVQKVIAVATAAFRNAANADQFIQKIEKETGIKIYIIDQDLEGKLAFEAALNQMPVEATDLVVWDIGGGSFQLTMQNKDGSYEIYRGHMASVPFKNKVIKEIQLKDRSVHLFAVSTLVLVCLSLILVDKFSEPYRSHHLF